MQWYGLSNDDLINEINAFLTELQNESDRGCALVGLAVLDDVLNDILEVFFADVPTTKILLKGSLRNITARINITYSLGLISRYEFYTLNLLNNIRNKFAHHSHGLTFDTKEIANLCSQIKVRYKIEGMEEAEVEQFIRSTHGQTPKGMFIFGVNDIFTRWIFRSQKVFKEKRKIQNWLE